MSMQYAFKVKISEHIVEDNIGQLLCLDVILARDGTYEYSSDEIFRDGKFNIVELHRDWEDVKKLKFTLEGKPVVFYHPDRDTDIDISNIKEFTVGHLQNVREGKAEGYNVLVGDLFINDPEVIEKVKSGDLREISLGYFYEIDDSDKNRIRQVDMIAEHIALVKQGRAGISRIMDAGAEYVMAKVRKQGEIQYLEFYEDKPLNDSSLFKLSDKGKVYGYYKFSQHIDSDQSTPISLQLLGLIVKKNLTGAFVALTPDGEVAQAYLYGKKADPAEMTYDGYLLTPFREEADPYAIPDEEAEKLREDREPQYHVNDIMILGEQLQKLIVKVEQAFRHNGDDFRGIFWGKMVSLIQHNRETVEDFIDEFLPTERIDEKYLHIAEELVAKARNLRRRAHDELLATMIVVAFDAEKSDIDIAISIDEAKKFFKKHGFTIESDEVLAKFIDLANDCPGVYIVRHDDYEQRIVVARTFSDNDVEVIICHDIDELNKKLIEHFDTLDEAFTSINTKQGRFSKMSAMML